MGAPGKYEACDPDRKLRKLILGVRKRRDSGPLQNEMFSHMVDR